MEYERKTVDVGSLKVGSFVIIDNTPCKVVDIKTSSTGKHGHAKARVEAIGIIDGRKRVIIAPTHEKVNVPIINKREAQVIHLKENSVEVMDLQTFETFELESPAELKEKLHEGAQVIYWEVMGYKVLKEVKG